MVELEIVGGVVGGLLLFATAAAIALFWEGRSERRLRRLPREARTDRHHRPGETASLGTDGHIPSH
jgi:hypothetical protein